MSVTTSESKNLLADCEALEVTGPDIISHTNGLPLKHRRKIIAIPVESEVTPQAHREVKEKIPSAGQSKLSPPTPFADSPHTPVECCFSKLKTVPADQTTESPGGDPLSQFTGK